MSNYLSGILSVFALFCICLAISFIALRIIRSVPRYKKQPKPKEAVYYVTEKPVKPKPKTVAIKGTLLSQSQLDELMKK